MNKSENFPRNILEQAKKVIESYIDDWNKKKIMHAVILPEEINEQFQTAKLSAEYADLKREERAEAINVRNTELYKLWDMTKRIRNQAKATFGDESPEIARYGGKPILFRKNYDQN